MRTATAAAEVISVGLDGVISQDGYAAREVTHQRLSILRALQRVMIQRLQALKLGARRLDMLMERLQSMDPERKKLIEINDSRMHNDVL